MKWKDYWKSVNNQEEFFKAAKLSQAELRDIQQVIKEMQDKGRSSSRIIEFLQKYNGKLIEKWQAERAYWTEVKHIDTKIVGKAGEELDINKYRVILSPNACITCRTKTNNGKKIFKNEDLQKSGYGQFVPWHPNCYCIVVPAE